mmetsp:Transcript_29424/g.90912  ORF Transcript_29424/g.90912 Transcript_29424/m.90912 type:complete len:235 (-) Transcript_29424:8-712(-)
MSHFEHGGRSRRVHAHADRDPLDELDALHDELHGGHSSVPADSYVDVEESPLRKSTGASPRDGHPYWLEEGHDAGSRRPNVNPRGLSRPTLGQSALARLRTAVPYLSPTFSCTDDDAELLLAYVAPNTQTANGSALEDKVTQLECEVKHLTSRLQKRTEEATRLKDDVAEARHKQRAVEAQSKQTANVLGQRREETRKQLLAEESRNSKLQFQNRTLQAEVDKLKERVHQLLSR